MVLVTTHKSIIPYDNESTGATKAIFPPPYQIRVYNVYIVYSVHTVYIVYIAYIVYNVYIVYIVYNVYKGSWTVPVRGRFVDGSGSRRFRFVDGSGS